MIVAADATILVRATKRADGPARRVIDTIIANPTHTLVLSEYILGEVGKVLCYPRIQELYRLTPEEVHEHVELLRSVAEIVEPVKGRPVVLSDPQDDPVLYTAVAGCANVLCTRDRHFFDQYVVTFCAALDMEVMDDLSLGTRLGLSQGRAAEPARPCQL
jgi:putative PIN family toxin of toxin-antitoxin system